jgi:type IV secretory pathway TrbL component
LLRILKCKYSSSHSLDQNVFKFSILKFVVFVGNFSFVMISAVGSRSRLG